VHEVAPVVAIYVAARQLEQLDDDVEDVYVPAKQFEHTVDEATEYVPAAQALVTVRPVMAQ